MITFEDYCVGCPQGCINCGRKSVRFIWCDVCGQETDNEDEICDDCRRKEEEEEEYEE